MNNTWVKHAISEIEADFQRSADTHLIRLNLPTFMASIYISKTKVLIQPAA